MSILSFFQALFALDPSEHGRRLFASQANGLDGVMEKPHTLEDYAVDHFRPPPKKVFSHFDSERQKNL